MVESIAIVFMGRRRNRRMAQLFMRILVGGKVLIAVAPGGGNALNKSTTAHLVSGVGIIPESGLVAGAVAIAIALACQKRHMRTAELVMAFQTWRTTCGNVISAAQNAIHIARARWWRSIVRKAIPAGTHWRWGWRNGLLITRGRLLVLRLRGLIIGKEVPNGIVVAVAKSILIVACKLRWNRRIVELRMLVYIGSHVMFEIPVRGIQTVVKSASLKLAKFIGRRVPAEVNGDLPARCLSRPCRQEKSAAYKGEAQCCTGKNFQGKTLHGGMNPEQ